MLKYSLDGREFRQLFSSHKSLIIGDLLFRYKKNNFSKLGLIVSKKYGNAVKRNLFKRRCRMLFDTYFKSKNICIIIQPKASRLSWIQLDQCFIKLHNQLYG
ncbi:MAG: ribonuclease P protein component [Candidatus Marinimicrobia bacterium]|nr:ribonuclease P protein component [Candidatus Neomarinimicrobiota bacterium]